MGSPIIAALTLSLTGPYERQGTDAAEGVRLWAEDAGVRLTLADDRSSKAVAVEAYTEWVGDDGVDLLLSPYSSGLVRAVAPLVQTAGRLLWNHGGSADDLAQPGIVSMLAPASSYFDGIVDAAAAHQVERLLVVQGNGPFARAVAEGAVARANGHRLKAEVLDAVAVETEDVAAAALVTAGSFEHDVAVIRKLRERRQAPALLGAVAAGISAFDQELVEAAEGVLGPVQWWPTHDMPKVGPSGVHFAARFQQQTGREPSYPAVQAAAAGYLAHAAHRHDMTANDVLGWRTSTLLGEFALDAVVSRAIRGPTYERGLAPPSPERNWFQRVVAPPPAVPVAPAGAMRHLTTDSLPAPASMASGARHGAGEGSRGRVQPRGRSWVGPKLALGRGPRRLQGGAESRSKVGPKLVLEINADWHQVGHRIATIRWEGGRMVFALNVGTEG